MTRRLAVLGFGFFCIMLFAFTSLSNAGIQGSDHDFSAKSWNTTGEICATCHTPHNADTSVVAPLWNHDVSNATYTLYNSPSLDATVGQPSGSSKACLSCHDGTVALDSFGGNTGTNFIGGDEVIGTSLNDDHPVSFTYDTLLATTDGDLADPDIVSSGLGSTISDDLLIAQKVECASCHDVHNSVNIDKLLRKNNANSALCMTCHTK